MHKKIQDLRNTVGHKQILFSGINADVLNKKNLSLRQMNDFSGQDRIIKQYFCLFGVKDDYGCVPMKGCFSKSINDRGVNSDAAYKITVLNQHRQNMPVAIPKVLKEDEIGLYAEYEPDKGVQHCEELLIQIRSGTINNGSYGFDYVWDKMKYDEKTDSILMYECELYELSPVTIGSQNQTFVVRSSAIDDTLEEDTISFLKKIPKDYRSEFKNLLTRHSLVSAVEPFAKTLESTDKPKLSRFLDYLNK